MCEALQPLLTFLHKQSSNASTCEMKSWTNFHKAAIVGFPSVTAFTGCKKSANALAFDVFEHVIEHVFCGNSRDAKKSPVHLSDKENDILSHIGGSIVFKLKKRYRSKRQEHREKCITCLRTSKPCNDLTTGPSLTQVLDRGGLTYLMPSAMPILSGLELGFREFFGQNAGKLVFTSYQSKLADVVKCSFFEITSACCVEEETKEEVFKDIVKLFFKIRCASKLRKIVRQLQAKKQITKKQKPLRKQLKKRESSSVK